MEARQKININSDELIVSDTGLTLNETDHHGRFFNKNGHANIEKRGIGLLDRISWFHRMIEMPTGRFLIIIFLSFFIINLFFAVLYYSIGDYTLDYIASSSNDLGKFGQAFFFSAQTFTTVGYGHISPSGFITNTLAALEALIGLFCFAIATSLLFGRFSKPTIFLKFSHNAVITPHKGGKALAFRLAPFKNTNYMDAEVNVVLAMKVEDEGISANKFFVLDLEMKKISSLVFSWTLVHPINEKSPLYKLTKKDFENSHGELLVVFKTFDNLFSTTVATRTSYTFSEIIYGAKFKPMVIRNKDNSKTILNIHHLNDLEYVDL